MLQTIFTTKIGDTPISAEIKLYYKGKTRALITVSDGFMEVKGFRAMANAEGEIYILVPQQEYPPKSKRYFETTRILDKQEYFSLIEFLKEKYEIVNESRINLPEYNESEIDVDEVSKILGN